MLRVKLFILLLLLGLSLGELQSNPKTQLKSVYERVFSRKKRAIIFPPGSFFKFTLLFSKGLLSTYPRGINFNLEEAVYFPIPGTRDDLYPKRFLPKKPTVAASKPETTFVYIPGTDWHFKAQVLPKPKPRPSPAVEPPKTQRVDNWNLTKPYKWGQKWANYGSNQAQKWQTSATKWSKWTTPAPKWTANWANRWNKYKPRAGRSLTSESRHFHGHRDRRQLFDHFSGLSTLLGIDVKSCILRTICDSKRLLLPPGYSMLQDMLRLVFTMPRLDGLEDDYSRIMSQDADLCARELKTKCNMNLLIWLLSGRLQ